MAITTTPAAGILQQLFAKAEATFNTPLAFAAGDAIAAIELKIEPTYEFHKSKEHVGSATLQTEIAGLKGGKWSMKLYVRTNAAGTAPDSDALLQGAFPSKTISGGVSVTYALQAVDAVTFQLGRYVGDGLYEQANGAWIEQIELEIVGNAETLISLSGGFATYGWCYPATTNGSTYAAAATAITLVAGQGPRVGVGAYIKFTGDNNAGAGYRVTAVAGDVLTITPGLAVGIGASATVSGNVPAPTYTGAIVGGVNASLTIDGTSIGVISGKITVKTGYHATTKEATITAPNRVVRGMREVAGELQVYYLAENATFIGGAWLGNLHNIVLRAGPNTAGSRFTTNVPNARIEIAPIEVPEAEESTATMKFVARKNAANEDEINLVFS